MADVLLDDGEEQQRQFGLIAELAAQKHSLTIPATEFSSMRWVLANLGPRAIIHPGQAQHARAAIQSFSTNVEGRRIYTHLGWRRCGEQWAYLHAGGAIGPSGPLAGLEVTLPPQLAGFALRQPAVVYRPCGPLECRVCRVLGRGEGRD